MIQFCVEKLHRLPEECGRLTLEGMEEAFEEYMIQWEEIPAGKKKKQAPKPGTAGGRTPEQLRALGLMPKADEPKKLAAQKREVGGKTEAQRRALGLARKYEK